jgi:hypothetical protein
MYKRKKVTGLLVMAITFGVNPAAVYAGLFDGWGVYYNTVIIDISASLKAPGNAAKLGAAEVEAKVEIPAGSVVKYFCSNGGEDDVQFPSGGIDTVVLDQPLCFTTEREPCTTNGGNTCLAHLVSNSEDNGTPGLLCPNDNWVQEKIVPSEAIIWLKLFYCYEDGSLTMCPKPEDNPPLGFTEEEVDAVYLRCTADANAVANYEFGDPPIPAQCTEYDPDDPAVAMSDECT